MTPKKLSDHSLVRLGRSATLEKLKNTVSAELFGKSPVLLLKWPILAHFGGSTQRPKRTPCGHICYPRGGEKQTKRRIGRRRPPYTSSECSKCAIPHPHMVGGRQKCLGARRCNWVPKNGSKTGPKQAQNSPKWPQMAPSGHSTPPLGAKSEMFGKKSEFHDGQSVRHPAKSRHTKLQQNLTENCVAQNSTFAAPFWPPICY